MTTAPVIEVQPKGEAWHNRSAAEVLEQIGSVTTGLSTTEASGSL